MKSTTFGGALLLAMTFTFGLVSCGGNDDEDNEKKDDPSYNEHSEKGHEQTGDGDLVSNIKIFKYDVNGNVGLKYNYDLTYDSKKRVVSIVKDDYDTNNNQIENHQTYNYEYSEKSIQCHTIENIFSYLKNRYDVNKDETNTYVLDSSGKVIHEKLTYDSDGYLTSEGRGWYEYGSPKNLLSYFKPDDLKDRPTHSYGYFLTELNDANIDLNCLVDNLGCGMDLLKLMGYYGKRSVNIMKTLRDNDKRYKYTIKISRNDQGKINRINVRMNTILNGGLEGNEWDSSYIIIAYK